MRAITSRTGTGLPAGNRRYSVKNESDAQRNVVLWLKRRRLVWCAVPNGGKREKLTALTLQREGLVSGVPDILIFSPSGRFVGLALEMKHPEGGTISDEQRHFAAKLIRCGWYVAYCAGEEIAIGILSAFYGAKVGVR